jgi:uncharacterized protein (DUF362 family)
MKTQEAGSKKFAVRAVRCPHAAPQSEVDAALRQITAPLARSWARLESARRIAIKANIVMEPERILFTEGRRRELVDDVVLRAVLRLLRERTKAHLLVVDSTYHPHGEKAGYDVHFRPLLEEFGAEYVECSHQPMEWFEVPGGGLLFQRYQLNRCFRDVDAMVSVAKMKSHAFMGVTLTTKNLFGLCPVHPENRPRRYFHHLVRLPFVLADLAQLLRPCLNVVDALVGQSRAEWNGEARVPDTLIAGDHPIATDVCAAALMGHDPHADWPAPPFRRDRNHLRLAAESGDGTLDLERVDFVHDLKIPIAEFDSYATDPREMVQSWRRTTCEQALFYRERREEFVKQYAKEYLFLQAGEVVWHGTAQLPEGSRRKLAGAHKESALWLKYVDPEEHEGERYETYVRELERLKA